MRRASQLGLAQALVRNEQAEFGDQQTNGRVSCKADKSDQLLHRQADDLLEVQAGHAPSNSKLLVDVDCVRQTSRRTRVSVGAGWSWSI